MKGLLVATVLVALVGTVLGVAVPTQGSSPRQARWFLRGDSTVTDVVVEERMVTKMVPWSCVVVAPSLPPCRHVRQLNIEATPPTPISATAAPAMPGFYGDHNLVEAARRRYYLDAVAPQDSFYGDMVPVPNHPGAGWVPLMARGATDPLPAAPGAPTTAPAPAPAPAPGAAASEPVAPVKREQGWAEWLGLRAYTTTSTRVAYISTTLVDPDTVVTFSVRGCQPSKLPFELPMCEPPQQSDHQALTAPAVEVAPAAPAAPLAPAAPTSEPENKNPTGFSAPIRVAETKPPAAAPAPTPAAAPAPAPAPAPTPTSAPAAAAAAPAAPAAAPPAPDASAAPVSSPAPSTP